MAEGWLRSSHAAAVRKKAPSSVAEEGGGAPRDVAFPGSGEGGVRGSNHDRRGHGRS